MDRGKVSELPSLLQLYYLLRYLAYRDSLSFSKSSRLVNFMTADVSVLRRQIAPFLAQQNLKFE